MADSNTAKRLFLLDGMALAYQAHFKMIRNPRFTSAGLCTSAVAVLANTLQDILKREHPTHMAVVFGKEEEPVPEEVSAQLPLVDRLFEAFRIPAIRIPVIGTLACQAERDGFTTWLVTPGKSLEQLVSERILIYKPSRQGLPPERLGIPEVLEKWKVGRIEQIIDILALMKLPGIGEKTAQKLIAEFGGIENLLSQTGSLKGKQRQLLESHAGQASLFKQQVAIARDIPHDIQLDDLKLGKYDAEAVNAFLVEMELREGSGPPPPPAAQAESSPAVQTPHDYKLIRTADERSDLLSMLLAQSVIYLGIVPATRNVRETVPQGIAFSFKGCPAVYVACPAEEALAVLQEFRAVFENDGIDKIGPFLKHQATLLRWHGIELRGKLIDTLLEQYLAGLQTEPQTNLRDLPQEQMAEAACEYADRTLQSRDAVDSEVEARGAAQVCHEVECPLIPVLVEMEYQGIRLDTAALKESSEQLARDIERLRNDIYEAAGREFNIESPKQLAAVLYEELKLADQPRKTRTGQFTTREDELLRLAGQHRIVSDVLDYRNAVKLKSVYVDQLPHYVNSRTGRVHTHYSQLSTSTGRIQSNHPNLQTIPVRKERGREVRAAFTPRDDDYLLLSADYSQIELRIMAELSGDLSMLEAFAEGTDIHAATAAKVFKTPLELVTPEMRDKAKAVNFGIIYGISAFGLQQRLNIPRDEARSLISSYFEKYPRIRAYIDETIAAARTNGYVTTRVGRRRQLEDIKSSSHSLRSAAERLAMNSPIQGTAADMLKLAMIKVHNALRDGRFQTRMLLTVHDEIVFDMHRNEQSTVVPVIEECMKTALPMQIPIVVGMGIGRNWLEAH